MATSHRDAAVAGGNVVEELYLPWVRFGVEDLAHKQDRVVLVELDEFDKRVIRHQVIGIFFGGRLWRGGGWGGGGRVAHGDICLGAVSLAPRRGAKGGGHRRQQPVTACG